MGPKSFRYNCNKPKYVTYSGRKRVIDNKELIINIDENLISLILDLFIKEGDEIKKGDIIFEYNYLNKKINLLFR